VTRKAFEENPVTGTGLGTYELSYERFFPEELKYNTLLNNKDAGSLGFRLVAETGLVGFALFCFFLVRCKLRSSRAGNPYYELCWIINSGIFVMIVLEVIRDGNYTNHGKFFFMLLYYYTYVLAKERIKSSEHESIAVAS
jgi:O-antigen ligase